jgi:hypothetical protein
MPRIIFDGDVKTADQLNSVATNLDLSKVRAMKLAVSVLHDLSKELGEGAELVIRKNGTERGLWLPFVSETAKPSPAGVAQEAPVDKPAKPHAVTAAKKRRALDR